MATHRPKVLQTLLPPDATRGGAAWRGGWVLQGERYVPASVADAGSFGVGAWAHDALGHEATQGLVVYYNPPS